MVIYDFFLLCGGLGLFLYGMGMMSEGFEKVAGDRLRTWLSMLTSKRIVGVLVGAGVTAIIQSSSATTVMLVGFVNAGVMTLQQTIGVIMGASVGTTVTGLIVAVKLTEIAPVFVLCGVVTRMFIKRTSVRRIGLIVLGFGTLFLGMSLMGGALEPLGDSELFKSIVVSMKHPLLGVLVGALATAVIQSSSAFTGILITLALQGLISLESAIPLVMGSNIGTCATALLASIGANNNAKRTAVAHLIYKIIGATAFMILYRILPVPRWIEMLFGDAEWQVAAFNTIYNIANCILLYPLARWIVKLAERVLPADAESDVDEQALIYFTESTLATPTLVIPQLLREVKRMIELSRKNLLLSLDAFAQQSTENLNKLNKRESVINYLNHELTRQLVGVSDLNLSSADRRISVELLHIIPDIERIGDHAQNIMEYVEIIVDNKLTFSDASREGIRDLSEAAIGTLDICTNAYFSRDESLFGAAETAEEHVDDLRDRLKDEHIDRLNSGACVPQSSMIYTDMLGDLERVSDHAMNFVTAIYDSRGR